MNTPLLEKYRNGDVVQYLNNLLEIVTTQKATDLQLAPQREALNNATNALNEAWQPNRGSELTPQIAELDTQRDHLFAGLKLTVDAWAMHHYDTEKKQAAYVLSDTIASHGKDITRLRYQQETATINAILNDLDNQYGDEVTLLGLTEWVTKLKTTNTEFNQKYMERNEALSNEQSGIVEQLRSEATAAFRSLKNIFEARMAIAEADNAVNLAEYQTISNQWSALTQQYNDAVTRNSGSNDAEV